jgi:hypothetical protein
VTTALPAALQPHLDLLSCPRCGGELVEHGGPLARTARQRSFGVHDRALVELGMALRAAARADSSS